MRQPNKLDTLERQIEETLTVFKRITFCLFETAVFLFGLYTLLRTLWY